MPHSSSFGITTTDDFFREIVIPQYGDFLANNSSNRHALLATIVSYHFYEWVHHKKFTVKHFKSAYPQRASVADAFETAREITNGTKHYKNKCVKTHTQKGFSSDFSDSLARPLIIEVKAGIDKSADILLRELVDFWKDQKKSGAF